MSNGAQIAATRQRNSNLRQDRLAECLDEVTRAYEAENSIDHLAQGYNPDVLCVPIGLYVPFAGDSEL